MKMLHLALLLVLATSASASAAEPDHWSLAASDWSRPRSGAAVLAMPAVAQAVRAWEGAVQAGDEGARLQLVHTSGEEGALWAAELRNWLISLGIPPDAIDIAPGGGSSGHLELRLLAGKR